jgi:hypothetical protein
MGARTVRSLEDEMAAAMEKGEAVASIFESATHTVGHLEPDRVAQILIESLDSVFHGKRVAVYVSTPITTGPRFVEWRRASGRRFSQTDPAFIRAVRAAMASNTAAVRPLVDRVENEFTNPVIDPTRLGDVPGWSQLDYHRFWVDVLTRYAEVVVFADGWSLSNGCALEFAAAVRAGLRTLSADLSPLSAAAGQTMLEQGSNALRSAGLDDSIVRRAIADLSAPDRPAHRDTKETEKP